MIIFFYEFREKGTGNYTDVYLLNLSITELSLKEIHAKA